MNTKLFIKYVRNYLCVLGITLVLLVPIYITVYQATKELVLAEAYSELEHNVTKIDDYIDKMVVKFLNECFTLRVEEFNEYLMFRDNDIVIGSGVILSEPKYHNYSVVGQMNMDFQQFKQMVFGNKQSVQYVSTIQEEMSSGIVGIMKVVNNARFDYDTALIFEINMDMIKDVFGIDNGLQNDFAYVADRNGEILYQVNCSEELLKRDMNGKQEIQLNGKKYFILQMEAADGGLHWTMGISSRTIEQEIVGVVWIIILYVIGTIIGMILLCVFIALNRAKNMGNMQKEMNELKRSIADNMLERLLLRGVYSAEEKEEARKCLGWDFDFYRVVCVSSEIEKETELFYCFRQVDEYFERYFKYASLMVSKREKAYLIHSLDTVEISDLFNELVNSQFGIRMGISYIGTGLENIYFCYQQAKLMNRQVAERYDIHIKEYNNQDYYRNRIFSLNLGNRIYDLICAEEKDELKELFERIRFFAAKSNFGNDSEVAQFFFEVQNPIARLWEETEQNNDMEMPGYMWDKNILELIDLLEDASYYLCDCISKSKETHNSALQYEIIQFVDDNYSNKDMCVAYVADHFKISNKYFSMLFRKWTGKRFGTYVESRRMQQVEKYLLETNLSMNQIADMVGYNTTDAFYKSFKKIYGLPPGKWKENNLK